MSESCLQTYVSISNWENDSDMTYSTERSISQYESPYVSYIIDSFHFQNSFLIPVPDILLSLLRDTNIY